MSGARRVCPCKGSEPVCEVELFEGYGLDPGGPTRGEIDRAARIRAQLAAAAEPEVAEHRGPSRPRAVADILDELAQRERQLRVVR